MKPAVAAALSISLAACASHHRVTLTPEQSRQVRSRHVELEVIERADSPGLEEGAASDQPRRLALEVDAIQARFDRRRRHYRPEQLPSSGDLPWFTAGLELRSVDLVQKGGCATTVRTIPAVLAGLMGGGAAAAFLIPRLSRGRNDDGMGGLAYLMVPIAAVGAGAAGFFAFVPTSRRMCEHRWDAVRVLDPAAPASQPVSADSPGSVPQAPAAPEPAELADLAAPSGH